jgi:hypothetical protein
MLGFREFILEGGYNVPVISLSKEKIDLSKADTRNEINLNLTLELSRQWINPYSAWLRISKVLSMYGITLPRVVFQDEEESEEVVVINQFGGAFGAELDGTQTTPNHSTEDEYYLYFNYGIGEDGFYETFAVVVDEERLNDLLDVKDEDIIEPEGELDPRQ